MFSLSSLLISAAYAQDAVEPTVASASMDSFMRFVPLFLILLVLYFLMLRPQQKAFTAHEKMTKDLKKGDKIITGGGILGTVTNADEEAYIVVQIADNVKVKISRSTVSSIVLPEPVVAANDKSSKEASK